MANKATKILYWRVKHSDDEWDGKIMFAAFDNSGEQMPELQRLCPVEPHRWQEFLLEHRDLISNNAHVERLG